MKSFIEYLNEVRAVMPPEPKFKTRHQGGGDQLKFREIPPHPEHHEGLLRAGLKHEGSHHTVQTSQVMKSHGGGKLEQHVHDYSAQVGYSTPKHAAWYGVKPNTKRSQTINAVKKHFIGKGYTHFASRGKSGHHYFERRDSNNPHDSNNFQQASDRAKMTTRHGHVHVQHTRTIRHWEDK